MENLKNEMEILNDIVSGKRNSLLDAKAKSMDELKEVIHKYPSRYVGFGTVPVGLNQNLYLDTSAYFSTLILKIAVNEVPLKCIFGVDMPYGDLEMSKEAIKKVCNESYITNAVLGDNMAKNRTEFFEYGYNCEFE
ncbi:hypothetical protein BS101_03695 [Clostridium kluyveri]|uniref:Amidohydrolase-related domain-containing protein n=1 Tax=Clostridium kluyveri TaxID=1534 RepID=A0A1L5F4M5_CLOKL|nr:hypothetical protein BS101_03695 [Clostridium kluyveri]